jgi:hypothetical protein
MFFKKFFGRSEKKENCKFDFLDVITSNSAEPVVFKYRCCVKVDKSEKIKSLNGMHKGESTDLNVTDLWWIELNSQFLKFPLNLCEKFSNIESIFIHKSNIKTISKHDLQSFAFLISFCVISSDIEYLPSDLFSNHKNMEAISFADNKISVIGPNLLSNLDKLIYVDLSQNKCINAVFDLAPRDKNRSYSGSDDVSLSELKLLISKTQGK